MRIKSFGKTKNEEEVMCYTLNNKYGMEVSLLDLGATIVSINVPDKEGNSRDVVLGYDTVADYQDNTCYFGATIGRNANRIENASCSIEGVECFLEVNDFENNLHSGSEGFHDVVWEAEYEEKQSQEIIFSYFSKDGEQGFPGNLTVKITYTLTDQNELMISYEGNTDKTTVFNLTNHAYYNLNGHHSGNIEEHELEIAASFFTPAKDGKSIPTGEIVGVEGTPMDFRKGKKIGQDMNKDYEPLKFAGGYDHNYVLDCENAGLRFAARAKSSETGICMELFTNCCGLQFYTGNAIKVHRGKEGVTYGSRHGFCLETQFFPNAVNESKFPSPLIRPGEFATIKTSLRFYTC